MSSDVGIKSGSKIMQKQKVLCTVTPIYHDYVARGHGEGYRRGKPLPMGHREVQVTCLASLLTTAAQSADGILGWSFRLTCTCGHWRVLSGIGEYQRELAGTGSKHLRNWRELDHPKTRF